MDGLYVKSFIKQFHSTLLGPQEIQCIFLTWSTFWRYAHLWATVDTSNRPLLLRGSFTLVISL